MKTENKHSWIKIKGYPHFGKQLTWKDAGFITAYVRNEHNIERHKFFPLIYRKSAVRKYKFVEINGVKVRKHSYLDDGKRLSSRKEREIFYANHLDSMVYSYYANEVFGPQYKRALEDEPEVDKAVLAYRKILKSDGRGKSNIDFAKEVFDQVRNEIDTTGGCLAIALDISSFFDSLSHDILLSALKRIQNIADSDYLPLHQYKVLQSLIDSSYVSFSDAIKGIGLKHPKQLWDKEIKSFAANYKEFRQRFAKKGKIRRHKFGRGKGIPQGTPISAFFSNVYLLSFDRWMVQELGKIGAVYRRYSDDIVIICSRNYAASLLMNLYGEIAEKYALKIQPAKTQITEFKRQNDRVLCQCLNTGRIKPFQYLGFEYDGERVLIRQASISQYYRRMKTAIRIRCNRVRRMQKARAVAFKRPHHLEGVLFKGPIYSRYSHLGNRKNRNYIHYAKDAAEVLNPNIMRQLRNSWKIVNQTIKERL